MKIEFKPDYLDYAAFQDGQKEWELARILKRLSDEVASGITSGTMHDFNGNKIGEWSI